MERFTDPKSVAVALMECERNKASMEATCRKVLSDWRDVQDAVQLAVYNAINKAPSDLQKGWQPWLRTVAKNAAIDIQRKNKKHKEILLDIPDLETVCDIAPSAEFSEEIRILFDRASRLLSNTESEDFESFSRVFYRETSERELADLAGISLRELQMRRKRGIKAIRDAIIAISLIDNPDESKNRCHDPRDRADREGLSPDLLTAIKTHVKKCRYCRMRWDKPNWALRAIASLGSVLAVGSLLSAVRSSASKAGLAAGAATTVVTVALVVSRPSMPELERNQMPRVLVPAVPTASSTPTTSSHTPSPTEYAPTPPQTVVPTQQHPNTSPAPPAPKTSAPPEESPSTDPSLLMEVPSEESSNTDQPTCEECEGSSTAQGY